MKYTEMENVDFQFYEINVNEHLTDLEWAKYTAYSKIKHTIDTWQKRTDEKRFTNIFLGDLAKNLFKTFLKTNRK